MKHRCKIQQDWECFHRNLLFNTIIIEGSRKLTKHGMFYAPNLNILREFYKVNLVFQNKLSAEKQTACFLILPLSLGVLSKT